MTDAPTMIACGLALALAAAGALADVRTGRIPNALTLGGVALGVVVAGASSGAGGAVSALFGAALAAIVPAILFRAGAMGGGDLKMFAALGALCGPRLGLEIETAAFCLGAVQGIAAWARAGRLRSGLAAAAALVIPPIGRYLARGEERAAAAATTIRLGPAIALGAAFALALARWG